MTANTRAFNITCYVVHVNDDAGTFLVRRHIPLMEAESDDHSMPLFWDVVSGEYEMVWTDLNDPAILFLLKTKDTYTYMVIHHYSIAVTCRDTKLSEAEALQILADHDSHSFVLLDLYL